MKKKLLTVLLAVVMVFGVFAVLPMILKAYNLSAVTAEATRNIIYFHDNFLLLFCQE